MGPLFPSRTYRTATPSTQRRFHRLLNYMPQRPEMSTGVEISGRLSGMVVARSRRKVRVGRTPGSPANREAILSAAKTYFERHGYEGSTIRGIADAAGVDPALLYHYFGSKDQLLVAALLGSQLMGLAMARFVIKLEPIASADPELLIACYAPTIQRYLTGPLPSHDRPLPPTRIGKGGHQ